MENIAFKIVFESVFTFLEASSFAFLFYLFMKYWLFRDRSKSEIRFKAIVSGIVYFLLNILDEFVNL